MANQGANETRPDVAVLIPCLNEAETIASVIRDFSRALPGSGVYVYDNGSTDGTMERAAAAGATVRRESKRGKGNVIRRMLGDIDADVYVMVDGDGTYDADSASEMVKLLLDEGLDFVNGARVDAAGGAYPTGHRFGNQVLSGLVGSVFSSQFKDMLSGCKVCSRRFAKSFPATSEGFEVETEMTIHALELRMPIAEIDVPYRERPAGSTSKLSTVRDGLIILKTIFVLIKEEKPLQFFSIIGFALGGISLALGIPVIREYLQTGLVPRFPTAILASALMILAFLSLLCGVILDSVSRSQRAMKRMHYLAVPGPVGSFVAEQKHR